MTKLRKAMLVAILISTAISMGACDKRVSQGPSNCVLGTLNNIRVTCMGNSKVFENLNTGFIESPSNSFCSCPTLCDGPTCE